MDPRFTCAKSGLVEINMTIIARNRPRFICFLNEFMRLPGSPESFAVLLNL
jgi:hypothetical protein